MKIKNRRYLKVMVAILLVGLLLVMPISYADSKGRQRQGINPDSFLYGIDVALDNIRYLLAINADAKAKVGLETAEERLIEVREMVLENKLEAAERANKEHGKALGKVKAAISNKGKSKGKVKESEFEDIEEKVKKHETEIQEMRNNLAVSIKAKGNITIEQQSVIDSILKSLANKTGEVKIKINDKKNEIKIKVEIEGEDKEERKDKEDKGLGKEKKEEDKENDEEKRDKAEEQIEVAAEAIAKAKAKLNASNNSSNAAKLIAQAELHLSRAKEAFNEGEFGKAFGQANSAEHLALNALRILEHKTIEERLNKGAISGFVFNDINGDGVRNGKYGIANLTVFLDANSNGILDSSEINATTQADGKYKFEGLAEGEYLVRMVMQQGWISTTPNPVLVEIDDGERVKVNFGSFKLGEIYGIKFEDSNSNGIKGANETGLANWTIKLTGPVTILAATDSSGMYSFVNLTYGIYNISEVQQAGWNQTIPNGSYTVNITSGLVASGKDFGNFRSI